jgi:hypothetical protein
MAIYRNIRISFWTDSKIIDDFTPEDRYFYLYLFTNPHTNLAGCYEISMKQMSVELGYDVSAVSSLIRRFADVHKVIKFSEETKEILILNWHKYNWTKSEKFRKPLGEEIAQVKDRAFREYLIGLFNENTVFIPYQHPTDTTVAVTDTVTVSDTDTVVYDFTEELSADEIQKLYAKYQNANDLIEQVQAEVNEKHLTIKVSAYTYICGYAKNKGWATK